MLFGQLKKLSSVLSFLDTAREKLSIEVLIEKIYKSEYNFITPWQSKYEILNLCKILQKQLPKRIIEIGTANGGTLYLFSHVAQPDAFLISIDLPNGRFGGGFRNWRKFLFKKMVQKNQKLKLILKNSQNLDTFLETQSLLNGEKVDFLFIDGDHTYEGVKKDFESYSKLVKPGGIIAFHDIVKGNPSFVGEVHKFWNEVKNNHKHMELVEEKGQEAFGIGVIFF
jgi:predicted O-methyltransferase YrrM